MYKNLVIVESPAKAKTIENYLGKDYLVASSYGHIRDLPKNNKAIDIENNFKPVYEVTKDKSHIVNSLKKLSAKSNIIYLASDDDREGESIAWHLKEALGLDESKTKRIVFREITKKAILNAIEHPRNIDMDLVNSQQARRILDRLVGFNLSPVLWAKIKGGLSAGRVQSVAVRMIVEREREIITFKPQEFFRVQALFNLEDDKKLESYLEKNLDTEEKVIEFLESCKQTLFSIANIEKKPGKKSPSAPFTTSTLQQEASQKLGFSVSQTMTLAQKLYEAGKISYMRTDSVNLSDEAITNIEKEIIHSYGKEYVQTRKYKTKSSNAQEAHEAIRPTKFSDKKASDDNQIQRLYNLIWCRTMASQMADAKLERTNVKIKGHNITPMFFAKGEVITFKGFLEIYSGDNDISKMLPPLQVGQKLDLDNINVRQRFTKPPARYTEAGLVKQLEDKGIGRPSTYAPTISTVQKRGYVLKETRDGKERKFLVFILKNHDIAKEQKTEIVGAEKNKLFPTDTAMVVNDFLVSNFSDITDYGFTAGMEVKLDEIAHKHKPWVNTISTFYKTFNTQVEKTGALERTSVKNSVTLGTDPKTGKSIIARLGKFGPLVQMGETNEETGEKPRFASLRKDQFIETITLEESLELFKLPRELGEFEDSNLIINIGRFGPYVKHGNKYYSIPKGLDPYNIEEKEAVEIIKNKREEDKKKFIKVFDAESVMKVLKTPEGIDKKSSKIDKKLPNNKGGSGPIQILNGRFGPYIKYESKNIRIPKDVDAQNITLEECKALIENAPKKPTRKAKPKKK